MSGDGTAAAVEVALNREWGIDFYSDCDGSNSSQSGSARYTVSVLLPVTRPLSCTINVSTSQPDGAVTFESFSVTVTAP